MLSNSMAVLYDAAGNPITGETGAAAPTGGIQIMGVDGAGNSRAFATNAAGQITTTLSAADTVATGALGALNDAVAVALAGVKGAGFQLTAGTLIGTLVPEISFDNVVWLASYFQDAVTQNKTGSMVFAAANAAQARSIYTPPGAGFARVRVSAFTSGTANATVRASAVDGPIALDTGAAASAAPPAVSQIGGSDGANLRPLLVDAAGRQAVVGAAADGAAAAGNPVQVAGVDGGGNVQALRTDTAGRLIQVDDVASVSAVTSVAASVASVNLLAANANRLGLVINNEGTSTLFVKMGAAASPTSYTARIPARGYWEMPFSYTGVIDGIWSVANGNAVITELTP